MKDKIIKKTRIIKPCMLALKIVYNLFVNKDGTTIKDIANKLKVDYKNIYDTIDILFTNGIIKKEKIGNYNVCKLNYFNDDIVEYLKEYNYYIKTKEFKKKHPVEYNILNETINKLIYDSDPLLFICVIFGSYSKDEEKENSDVDILFIPYVGSKADFKRKLDETNKPYHKKFHVETQPLVYFIKDLKEKNKVSIATEIYKYPPIVLCGDDIFFKMIVGVSKLW